jgi:hypothetical protein
MFTRETFAEFPDLRVAGRDFKDARRITDANPQQAEYTWGRRILFDYTNKKGVRLQGILALPDITNKARKGRCWSTSTKRTPRTCTATPRRPS